MNDLSNPSIVNVDLEQMRNEIVERVAAAISAAMDEDLPKFTAQKWSDLSLPAKQAMMKRARAAIKAMRTPTSDMLNAGDSYLPQFVNDETLDLTGYDVLKDVWPAMIDEALK